MSLFAKRFHFMGFMSSYVGLMYLLFLVFPQYHNLIVFTVLIPPVLSSLLLVYVWYVFREGETTFWFLLGMGNICFLVAQCILTYYDLSGNELPSPGMADVFWSVQSVFHIAALFFMFKKKSKIIGVSFVFNTLILVVVAGILGWEYMVKPNLPALIGGNSLFEIVSALIYPVSSIVKTFLLFLLFFTYRELITQKVLMWLAFGFLVFTIADTFYFIEVALGSYQIGIWFDSLYAIALFAISLSGLYSIGIKDQPWIDKEENRIQWFGLIIPYSSLVLLLGLMLYRMEAADTLVIGTVITILLLIVRQVFVLLENDSLVYKLKEALRQMSYQADHDELSALPNRRLFERRLSDALQKNDQTTIVLFTDLDRFKYVNDSLGHEMGDQLIRQAADRLKDVIGACHTAARFGGDEFAVLLEACSGQEEGVELSKQIIQAFTRPFQIGNHKIQTTISIGLAASSANHSDVSEMMKHADAALYITKEMGGNGYHSFNEELRNRITNKVIMERDLGTALDNGEFELHYQPQVETSTCRILGAEALVRWRRPGGILVSPAQFIPLAEETGFIIQLGEWVLRTACEDAVKRERLGQVPIQISVNVSPRQLRQVHFVNTVKTILKETGFSPTSLVLEITEGIAMEQSAETVDKLRALKELGLHLSMDDFGTGYSSLGYLKTFGVDSLKIAQTFIHELTEKPEQAQLVNAIMAMAYVLKLKVIVEGVETEEQFAFFKDYDKCWIQGYYFYKPMPINDLLNISEKINMT